MNRGGGNSNGFMLEVGKAVIAIACATAGACWSASRVLGGYDTRISVIETKQDLGKQQSERDYAEIIKRLDALQAGQQRKVGE